jgi:hypothetical protein
MKSPLLDAVTMCIAETKISIAGIARQWLHQLLSLFYCKYIGNKGTCGGGSWNFLYEKYFSIYIVFSAVFIVHKVFFLVQRSTFPRSASPSNTNILNLCHALQGRLWLQKPCEQMSLIK